MSHAYRDRWQVLGSALTGQLPQSARIPTFGGTSYWVQGPPQLDACELARVAREDGILLEPGDVHFMDERPPRNCFRLGFSSITSDRIRPGIEKLANLVRILS